MPAPRPDRSPSPAQAPPSAAFGLFVRAVEGHVVSRYHAGAGPYPSIGVRDEPAQIEERDDPKRPGGKIKTIVGTGRRLVWDTKTIHALTHAEIDRFGNLYARHLREGALTKASAEEYDAQVATSRAAKAEAVEKAKTAAEEAARAKAAEDTSTPALAPEKG
jgi:hypothetical protein